MLKNKSKIPGFVSYCALSLIRSSLKKKCGYDVLSSSPINAISSIKTPSIFIIGENDDMVLYKKFLKMFEKCNSHKKKLIVEIDAGHPDSRTEECIDQIMDFLNVDSMTNSELDSVEFGDGNIKASLSKIFFSTNASETDIDKSDSDNIKEKKEEKTINQNIENEIKINQVNKHEKVLN